ncbi:hypothetical protein BURMUCF1_A1734 [Burkholderia multivorans ATCC BAA-247]|nr:hypothetical protein BURMUCF1_A1734 [Burkholderia multivorans ATCC BAA-247]
MLYLCEYFGERVDTRNAPSFYDKFETTSRIWQIHLRSMTNY